MSDWNKPITKADVWLMGVLLFGVSLGLITITLVAWEVLP